MKHFFILSFLIVLILKPSAELKTSNSFERLSSGSCILNSYYYTIQPNTYPGLGVYTTISDITYYPITPVTPVLTTDSGSIVSTVVYPHTVPMTTSFSYTPYAIYDARHYNDKIKFSVISDRDYRSYRVKGKLIWKDYKNEESWFAHERVEMPNEAFEICKQVHRENKKDHFVRNKDKLSTNLPSTLQLNEDSFRRIPQLKVNDIVRTDKMKGEFGKVANPVLNAAKTENATISNKVNGVIEGQEVKKEVKKIGEKVKNKAIILDIKLTEEKETKTPSPSEKLNTVSTDSSKPKTNNFRIVKRESLNKTKASEVTETSLRQTSSSSSPNLLKIKSLDQVQSTNELKNKEKSKINGKEIKSTAVAVNRGKGGDVTVNDLKPLPVTRKTNSTISVQTSKIEEKKEEKKEVKKEEKKEEKKEVKREVKREQGEIKVKKEEKEIPQVPLPFSLSSEKLKALNDKYLRSELKLNPTESKVVESMVKTKRYEPILGDFESKAKKEIPELAQQSINQKDLEDQNSKASLKSEGKYKLEKDLIEHLRKQIKETEQMKKEMLKEFRLQVLKKDNSLSKLTYSLNKDNELLKELNRKSENQVKAKVSLKKEDTKVETKDKSKEDRPQSEKDELDKAEKDLTEHENKVFDSITKEKYLDERKAGTAAEKAGEVEALASVKKLKENKNEKTESKATNTTKLSKQDKKADKVVESDKKEEKKAETKASSQL